MRERLVGALSVLALVICGCQPVAAPGTVSFTATPVPTPRTTAAPAATPAPTDTVLPTADATSTAASTATHGVVVLHGTFVGHDSSPEGHGDATFNVDVNWNRPVDVHNRLEFQFASGSFSVSESVVAYCGGSREAAGSMRLYSDSDHGALVYGDSHAGDYVTAEMIDNRLNQGGLILEFGAYLPIPIRSPDCEPPYQLSAGAQDCGFEFQLLTTETMQTDLSCSKDGNTWTGHLAP